MRFAFFFPVVLVSLPNLMTVLLASNINAVITQLLCWEQFNSAFCSQPQNNYSTILVNHTSSLPGEEAEYSQNLLSYIKTVSRFLPIITFQHLFTLWGASIYSPLMKMSY